MTTKSYLAAGAVGCLLLLTGCGSSGSSAPDIAFVSSRDGDYAIYGMKADGSSQRRLTDERGDTSTSAGVEFQTDPAWSPDGTRIAFASAREGSFDIYVMNADGTGTKRLTSSGANDQGPTWSPDGSRIAFARSDDGGHVWLMNADGTGAHRLTDDDITAEGEPAWSPDGRWIAYTHRASGSDLREIWVVHPDGSGRRSVTKLEAKSYAPAWAPDAKRLAFSADEGRGALRHLHDRHRRREPATARSVPGGRVRAGVVARRQRDSFLAWRCDRRRRRSPAASGSSPIRKNNDSSPAWKPRPEAEKEGS